MRLILQHAENPDLMYGQGNGSGYHSTPSDTRDPGLVTEYVETLREASRKYRAWIERNRLGSGNLCAESGYVYPDAGGDAVAKVSFNGRVMTPQRYGDAARKEIKV